MANIYTTIKKTVLTYDPNVFMPIYRDHKLANMDEFVKYKAGRVVKHLTPPLIKLVDTIDDLIVSK